MKSYRELAYDGLWKNNPAFVQLLGLCPLLAVSNTVINALGLGLATVLVLTGSNLVISLIRNRTRAEIRIPIFVMVIAALVTAIELLMNAYLHQLYLVLGIFIPLIVTNCAIIGRAEAFAARNSVGPAALGGLAMGLGFTGVLLALGAVREVLGRGTLLADAQLMFGPAAADWTWQIADSGWLLMALPPGAFIVLGFLIAGKNGIDRWRAQRAQARLAALGPAPAADTAADTAVGRAGPA